MEFTPCVLFRDIRLASLDMDWVSQQPWNKNITTIREAVSAWTRGRELDGIEFNGDPETRLGIFCPKFCLKVMPATAH